ncbi:alpha/beta hydrolase [Nitritalea halalkaliphila LW7]|uniref:Alpha/beta hydrolase n=1 Tax=Nitritalea halalkaliphila LW7 TaxID=1189621 RepID=I5BZV3_9BACT|nr:alpha/beta fold hydrolase [Nitritalea halalkaliphila]EIM75105.1 alpha/beta hydrolase [Nitritalea halalkaliphila LW7]
MPTLHPSDSTYQAPSWLFNGHLQTIYPALFRKPHPLPFVRERIFTPDADFLALDRLRHKNSKKILILSHGLEGNSNRPYMTGMAKSFFFKGFDVISWNYRGCSGEPNLLPRFYHSGATEDLHEVVKFASSEYEEIYLVGFSLGGNLTLKYVGELGAASGKIKGVAALSVPVHLADASRRLAEADNILYTKRFLKTLKEKVAQKAQTFPEILPKEGLANIRTLAEFDDRITAPLHGFAGAADYYQQCAALQFMPEIRVPTLLLNAQNDPFLSPSCFPFALGKKSQYLHLEFPEKGGHVGFTPKDRAETYWSERRVVEFMEGIA